MEVRSESVYSQNRQLGSGAGVIGGVDRVLPDPGLGDIQECFA